MKYANLVYKFSIHYPLFLYSQFTLKRSDTGTAIFPRLRQRKNQTLFYGGMTIKRKLNLIYYNEVNIHGVTESRKPASGC